ncbi:MAG: CDP-diacylglycerol/serine O-phosphatidyltransferase [Hyphomicrobiales bacterium]|nr:CDP-diacylglycerol/serine O-phosphatidyltransferase [Hyphomicrobiales bacterium]
MNIDQDDGDLDASGGPLGPATVAGRPKRFARLPMRIVLPNLVTLLALCLGLTSIRFAAEGRFETAVVFIVAAAILDGLDGRLARALDGTTRFGAELDSLADFVDFGVAPGLLLYFWSLSEIKSFGWFAAMVFAIACALRLARFNVMIDDPEKPAWHAHFFVGMPAPAGAIVSMLPIYLHYSVLGLPNSHLMVAVEIAYVLLVAFLMVSRIPHYSGKQIGRVPREYFIPVLFGVAALILLLATFPMEVLVFLALAYLGLIFFAWRSYQAYQRADAAAAIAPHDAPPAS